MKSLFLSIVTFLIFIGVVNSHALVYTIKKWQQPTGETVWTLHDCHPDGGCDDQNANEKQRSDIIEAARVCNGLVIAEDIYDYTGTNHAVSAATKRYAVKDRKTHSCINLLMAACRQKGVRCWNAECRHLTQYMDDKTVPVSSAQVLEDMLETCKSICAIDKKCAFYKEILEFNKDISRRFLSENDHLLKELEDLDTKPVSAYIQAFRDGKEFGFGDSDDEEAFIAGKKENLFLFDWELVDGRIAKKVGPLALEENNIFICVGFDHAEHLEKLLPQLGYRLIKDESVIGQNKLTKKSQKVKSSCGVNIRQYFDKFTSLTVQDTMPNKKQKLEASASAAGSAATSSSSVGSSAAAASTASSLSGGASQQVNHKQALDNPAPQRAFSLADISLSATGTLDSFGAGFSGITQMIKTSMQAPLFDVPKGGGTKRRHSDK